MGEYSSNLSMADIQAALLGNNTPLPEGATAIAGSTPLASKVDHQHPRLSATNIGVLAGDGTATLIFTRLFSIKPSIIVAGEENNNNPVPRFKVKSWTQDGSNNFTGCIIFGDRARALPALGGILLIGPLIAALAGYLPYEPAAGAAYLSIAIASSQ